MTDRNVIDQIKGTLGESLIGVEEKSPRRLFVEVTPKSVVEASRLMFEDLGARFQIASGVDTPNAIEILYHWALDGADCVVTLRARLDRDDPEIDSVADVCPAAEWIEREMWELLGVRFLNHPDLRHLLLDDDWPEGQYPLRRDYGRDTGHG